MKANSTYAIVQSLDKRLGQITYGDIISLLGEQTQSEIPIFIIGMPNDPFETEHGIFKFHNIVEHASKISTKIEKDRCIIKI